MGGVMILAWLIVVTSLFYVKAYPKIIPILFVMLGFGLIGFLDDYLKVVLRRSDGLLPEAEVRPWADHVMTAVFVAYLSDPCDSDAAVDAPDSVFRRKGTERTQD